MSRAANVYLDVCETKSTTLDDYRSTTAFLDAKRAELSKKEYLKNILTPFVHTSGIGFALPSYNRVDKLNTRNCMYTTPEYKYATANRIKSIPEELKLKPPVRVMAPVMPSKIIVF